MSEGDEYGLIDITIIVPGRIEFLTDGGELEKNDTARFSGETPLVVFKKGGGGFPVWIIPPFAAIFIMFIVIKRRPSAAHVVSPPVTTQSPDSIINTSADSDCLNSTSDARIFQKLVGGRWSPGTGSIVRKGYCFFLPTWLYCPQSSGGFDLLPACERVWSLRSASANSRS